MRSWKVYKKSRVVSVYWVSVWDQIMPRKPCYRLFCFCNWVLCYILLQVHIILMSGGWSTEKNNELKKNIIVRAFVHYWVIIHLSAAVKRSSYGFLFPMAIASCSLFSRQRGYMRRERALARSFFTTVLARTALIEMNRKKNTILVYFLQALCQISSKNIN